MRFPSKRADPLELHGDDQIVVGWNCPRRSAPGRRRLQFRALGIRCPASGIALPRALSWPSAAFEKGGSQPWRPSVRHPVFRASAPRSAARRGRIALWHRFRRRAWPAARPRPEQARRRRVRTRRTPPSWPNSSYRKTTPAPRKTTSRPFAWAIRPTGPRKPSPIRRPQTARPTPFSAPGTSATSWCDGPTTPRPIYRSSGTGPDGGVIPRTRAML